MTGPAVPVSGVPQEVLDNLGLTDTAIRGIPADFMADQNVHLTGTGSSVSSTSRLPTWAAGRTNSSPRCYRAPGPLPGYREEMRRQEWP